MSLGGTLRDYLSGEDIPQTTFEDFRQALARLLVEEKGYPLERLRSKVGVRFPMDGETYCRVVDLVATEESGRPLLVVLFSAGAPGTYTRETVAAARLLEDGPAPLGLVSDTKDAVLLDAVANQELATGMRAIPAWEELLRLAAARPTAPLPPDRVEKERRILYAYSELLASCCPDTCCPLPRRTP